MLARIMPLPVVALSLGAFAFAELGPPAQNLGPKGYAVSDVELLPGSPGTLLAAVGPELLQSTDGGVTLSVTGFNGGSSIEDVAVSGNGLVYVASGDRVYVSSDSGATFASTVPFAGTNVVMQTIEVHPTNPLEAWAGYGEGSAFGGVVRTTDGGQSWSDATPPGWVGPCVAIAFDTQGPGRILLVRRTFLAFLSTDSGATWTQSQYVNAGTTGIDAAFLGGNIVLSTSGLLRVTSDDGSTWSTVPAPASLPGAFSIGGVAAIAPDPSTPGRAVLASRSGALMESSDNGLSWSDLAGPRVGADALVINAGEVALMATPYGLLRRTPSATYERAALDPGAAGLDQPLGVEDLSIDPADPARIAAVVRPTLTAGVTAYASAIATTATGGSDWGLDTAFPSAPICVDHGPNGELYAGRFGPVAAGDASATLQRLSPSGWQPIGPTSVDGDRARLLDVEVAPADPNRLFAVTDNSLNAFEQEHGFWRSLDGGASWQKTQSATLSIVYGSPQVTVFGSNASGEPRVAYIQRLDSGGFPGFESLLVSEDGGATWASRAGASYFDAETMNVSGGGAVPGRLYLAKTSPVIPVALQFSDDGGLTWDQRGDALAGNERVAASANEASTVYLTAFGELRRGTYAGASVEGLFSIADSVDDVRTAAVPTGTLLAAFGSSGVWVKVIPTVTGVSYCGPAVANSTGEAAELRMEGSPSVGSNDLALVARRLPSNSTSLSVVGDAQAFVAQPGGSFGNLCLGGAIGRFTPQAGSSGPGGVYVLPLDLGALPRPGGTAAAMPGQTLYFQTWFRDAVGGAVSSNFTDAVGVTFEN